MKKESIESILYNGFKIWRKNKIIGVAYVAEIFLLLLLIIIFSLITFPLLGNILFKLLSNISEEAIDFSYIGIIQELIFILLPILLIFLLFTLIVISFFTAGEIGMTKEAIQKGKTTIDDMLFYGRKKFLTLSFAGIIIFFLQLLGLIFLIPGLMGFILNSVRFGILLSVIGIFLLVLYLFILSIIMIFVPITIVIDNLNAIDGIKRAYGFFMNNKISVLILWVAASAVYGILNMLLQAILPLPLFLLMRIEGIGIILSILLMVLIILVIIFIFSPIIALWWTALYLDRTGKKILTHITETHEVSVDSNKKSVHI